MFVTLYLIIVKPIELIIEVIFDLVFRVLGNPGIAIVVVSLVINFLILPLYSKADKVQEKERKRQEKLRPWIKHIRKSFKGDERFMMLSAYYKTQNYSPIYAIGGSISLFLQIPFFIAAYQFLSNLNILNGASFLIIKDLGAEDGLLKIGSNSLNLLPIIMTLINIVSGIIYTKGFPLKDKIQLYTLAALFLILLYRSPSGLVLYWTLNNIFSLGKNVYFKVLRHPKEVFSICCSIVGIVSFIYVYSKGVLFSGKRLAFFIVVAILLQMPLLYVIFRKKINLPTFKFEISL